MQLPSLRYAAIIPPILLNYKGAPKFKTAHYRKTRSDAKGDSPMKDKPLANVRVAILATNDFEQSEMTEPRQALKEAGAQTTLIAPKAGKLHTSSFAESMKQGNPSRSSVTGRGFWSRRD
jgi:hypothetical protein